MPGARDGDWQSTNANKRYEVMELRPMLLAAAISTLCLPVLAAEESAATGIRAVFQAHEKAMNSQDLEAVMKLYAPGDKTVVMGTGPGEVWVGKDQIANAYKHFFADFDAHSIKRSCPWELGDVSGDVGWLSATCDYKDSLKGTRRAYALNVSVVLQKLKGEWKLRSMHFSNLVSGKPSEGGHE
jgi:ketosteroid isomerase-like protein